MTRARKIGSYEGPHGLVRVDRISGRYRVVHVNHSVGWRDGYDSAITLACTLAGLPVVEAPRLDVMTDLELQSLACARATVARIRTVFRAPYPDERRLYLVLRRAAHLILQARVQRYLGDSKGASRTELRAQQLRKTLPEVAQW